AAATPPGKWRGGGEDVAGAGRVPGQLPGGRARPGGAARLRDPPRRLPGVRDVPPRLRRRDPARAGVRRDRRRGAGRGPGAAGAGDRGRAPAGVKRAPAARHRRPGANMFRGGTSMTIALEIAAGMVLTTALVT